MEVIDLCSGLGGFSQAFLDRDHNVIRIDNNPKFQDVPNTIIEDILTMNFKPRADFKKPDILLMSPTCTEFCKIGMPWYPKNETPDMKLIEGCIEIKNILQPKYWILENVRNSQNFINPLLGNYKKKVNYHYLWGEFPIFNPISSKRKGKISGSRPELRSKIPYSLSLALCLAIENNGVKK